MTTNAWRPPSGTPGRSWIYRDVLAYLRGLASEGQQLQPTSTRAVEIRAYLDETLKAATHRERQEASELFQRLVRTDCVNTNHGGGQSPVSVPVPAAAPASARPELAASPHEDVVAAAPTARRQFVDTTQRRLTAAQAERELLPVIYEGGWFGQLAAYTQHAQAPPAYFFGAALTIAGAAFAARPRILWEQGPLYTNLYTVLVGESGTGKSTAVEWAQAIMQPALGNHLLGNDGTPQGFMRGLHERWELTRLCADGLIIADEYKSLIGREKHKEQLVTFLTACYGKHGPFDRILGAGGGGCDSKYYFENPRVSIVAGTTMEWWRNSHEDAVLGGYVPRHFIFESVADEWTNDMNASLGAMASHNDTHPLTEALRDIVVQLPHEIELSPDAWAYVNHWRNEEVRKIYMAETDKEVRGWLRRKPTGVLKVATICHLINRHAGPVCIACAHWARRVIDWQDYGVRRVYSDLSKNRLARLTRKIVEIVERAGPAGVSTGAIRKNLRHSIKRKEVEEVCGDLMKEGVMVGDLDMGNDMIWKVK